MEGAGERVLVPGFPRLRAWREPGDGEEHLRFRLPTNDLMGAGLRRMVLTETRAAAVSTVAFNENTTEISSTYLAKRLSEIPLVADEGVAECGTCCAPRFAAAAAAQAAGGAREAKLPEDSECCMISVRLAVRNTGRAPLRVLARDMEVVGGRIPPQFGDTVIVSLQPGAALCCTGVASIAVARRHARHIPALVFTAHEREDGETDYFIEACKGAEPQGIVAEGLRALHARCASILVACEAA